MFLFYKRCDGTPIAVINFYHVKGDQVSSQPYGVLENYMPSCPMTCFSCCCICCAVCCVEKEVIIKSGQNTGKMYHPILTSKRNMKFKQSGVTDWDVIGRGVSMIGVGEYNFDIYSSDSNGNAKLPTGLIKKYAMGMMDIVESSTILEVTFPKDASNFSKFSLMTATVLADELYFDSNPMRRRHHHNRR